MTTEPTVLVFPVYVFDGITTEPPLSQWTEDQLNALVSRESIDRVVLNPWHELSIDARQEFYRSALRFQSRSGISVNQRRNVADQLVKLAPFVSGKEDLPMV